MQWMYPCTKIPPTKRKVKRHGELTYGDTGGGMPTSTNRTKWPVNGGAIAFQPGWFSGHMTAFFYVNLGLGTEPLNMSHPVVPVFQMLGPSNDNYGGSICLPQVPMPANITFEVGDNVTIQVIEVAVHGASLYSVCGTVYLSGR